MLDIITILMCYYFQSSMRSIRFQYNAGSLVERSSRPLESVPCSPPFPRTGACTVKKNGCAPVTNDPCSKPLRMFPFPFQSRMFPALPVLSVAVLGAAWPQSEHSEPCVGGLGYWVCRGGSQVGRGLGAKAELSLTSSSEGGPVFLVVALWGFVVVIFESSLEGTARGGRNSTVEAKEQL